MADPFSKKPTVPAKTAQAPASKQHAPAIGKADSASPDRVSLGLLSLIVGSVALSFFSIPYLLGRILAVMLSLGGITLAVLQFRTNEKAGRNFNGAIAGTLFSAAVIVLTAIGPYLPIPEKRVAQAPIHTSIAKPAEAVTPTLESTPQPKNIVQSPQAVPQTTAAIAEKPIEVPQIPSNVPKVIPFPCRKSFQLVPSASPEWADASSSAVLQGEVAVCVASAAIERLDLVQGGKPIPSTKNHLVIHLQVVLIGTTRKVDFESWGNSNFGDARNKLSLTDNSNHVDPLATLATGTQVIGHERSKGLYPKLYADDYLVFEAPSPTAEYLHLELPASAFGEMGALRFKIPKSMIEGVKGHQPAK